MAFRGPKVWLWRWRRNPLKRRADAVEAWVLLAAWALTLLTGVFTGLATAGTVERGMARERVEWRPVVALLSEQAPGTSRPGTPSGASVWGKVRWSTPDGASRTGQARVRPGSGVGTPVTVWTDAQGRLVTRPATESEARSRAALVGGLVGVFAASVPFVGGRALRSRLESRRIDRWGYEWARFGPLWGGRTPG
ncbi:Rv1733c family protein [Streptomyces sp. NPDC001920]